MENEKKNLTVFGSETDFDGILEFSDNLVIAGKFNGTIRATGSLEIAKNAVCTVDTMSARSIIVSGSVTGNIEATEHLEMCSGSTVKGDIATSRLRIAENVNFEGSVTMLETDPDVDLFSVSSTEYKNALTIKSNMAH